MRHHIRRLLSIILFFLFLSSLTFAAETRSLRVIANDSASGRQGEVKLYNKAFAVIIGIDLYKNLPADRQLQNAVKDAKGVEAVLRKNYQFDKIITLHNEQATKDRIMEVLTEELPAQMGKEDALFLFWAGHGNQEKSDFGEIGYLIPYDGSVDKIRKNLTMAEIRDTISKKIPAKHIFYVMDACYGGLLAQTRSVDSKTRRDLSYLKEITKESARQVLTAGGKGEEALDGGPKGHSVFTGRLIEILESASDFITANELQASIREKVYSDASARNHTQTPGFGALYGLGDFVFIPKHQDRLGDLTGTSASRQKELEQLQKAEDEAKAAKQREQAEIAKKEKELASLDKQIAEMKGRLGTKAARKDDNMDQILAMVEQKEEQGKRLEILRQQRDAEEQKRLQEIAQLRQKAREKRAGQVNADLAKYQKVASSTYAGDLKTSAWQAMVANYPEARMVPVGEIYPFLDALGLTVYDGEVLTVHERRKAEKIAKEIWADPRSDLMWSNHTKPVCHNWQRAKTYCENYRGGGYTGWRMPAIHELHALCESGAHPNHKSLTSTWSSSEYFPDSRKRPTERFFYKCEQNSRWADETGIVQVLAVRSMSKEEKLTLEAKQRRLEKERQQRNVKRAWLGVSIQPITEGLANQFNLQEKKVEQIYGSSTSPFGTPKEYIGVLINDVKKDGPAEKAGILRGDIMLVIDGEEITDGDVMLNIVADAPVGQPVTVEFLRNGKAKTIEVTLTEMPSPMQQAQEAVDNQLKGVLVENLSAEMKKKGLPSLKGVLVSAIDNNSPAKGTLLKGDIIMEINRKNIESVKDYEALVSTLNKSKGMMLLVYRNNTSTYMTLAP